MREEYTTTSHGRFAYCKTHNRLYAHSTVGWVTPAHPEALDTFQALCDECKGESHAAHDQALSQA